MSALIQIFQLIQSMAIANEDARLETFLSKHLDLRTEADLREFKAHFEIWQIRETQENHVGKMRQWEKAYNRGTVRQSTL